MKNNKHSFICDRCGKTKKNKIELRYFGKDEVSSTSTIHGLCTACEKAVRQNEENQEMFMEVPPLIYYHVFGV